ncbi:MAG: pre-rRNA-processing protein esf1 [Trichoglossum hirsutum]|nr:MAG: pre-rRNA-processing protein esf1 [Trichoglossum hirsutum]
MGKPPRQKAPLGGRQNKSIHGTITDPRFSNIHTDPRYRLPSKKHTHVKLDKRFSHMLRDGEFSRKATVDRYGRKVSKDAGSKALKGFYRIDEESEDELDDDEEVKRELKRVEGKYDPAREGGFSSSSESSSEEEEEEEEEVDGEGEVSGLPDDRVQQEADVPMGEVSSRLAAVNLDWDNIRAVDLMAAFSSFKPPQGRILKVAVYPSEFGRERMEREEMEGPPKEIFGSNVEDPGEQEEEEEEEEDLSEENDEEIKKAMVREDKGEEFDSANLRRYQLERLRYYYAVITFDSPETAKTIYDATDGTEYLTSANFFDLRFIPDSVSFDADTPRDEVTSIPDNYRPNEFVTDALQHSKVKLTWDADDGVRKEVVRKAFGRREVEEQDLKAYLGNDSSSSSSEDEGARLQGTAGENASGGASSKKEAERKRLRALLGLDEADSGSKKKGVPVGDMQITFSSGLAGDSKNKGSIFEETEETTVDKYIRKERERKQRRKEKMKLARTGVSEPVDARSSSDTVTGNKKDDHDDHDDGLAKPSAEDEDEDGGGEDLGFDDPFFVASPSAPTTTKTPRESREARRAKREQRARDAKAEATKRAELELLMLDDDHIADPNSGKKLQHFDINEVLKAEKAKAKRGKKGARRATAPIGAAVQENFKMDVDDPRFSRLWDSHEFAIDPTNPRFRKTEGMKMLLEESRKKRRREGGEMEGEAGGGGGGGKGKRVKETSGGDGDDLKRLVERVKGRVKRTKERA